MVEKNKFLFLVFDINSFKLGSKIGNFDKSFSFHAFIHSLLISTTWKIKSGHFAAITVIVGPPTYPAPMQQIFFIGNIIL